MIGTACWSSVRPAIVVRRCRSAREAHAAPTSSSRAESNAIPSRTWSTTAVSIRSWLVAPQCTNRRTSASTSRVIACTSGTTGVPVRAVSR